MLDQMKREMMLFYYTPMNKKECRRCSKITDPEVLSNETNLSIDECKSIIEYKSFSYPKYFYDL